MFQGACMLSVKVITAGVATGKAPSGSPFTDGGVVIVEGATGYGKVCAHIGSLILDPSPQRDRVGSSSCC
eukprot:3002090-Amphidinium_carterae.2